MENGERELKGSEILGDVSIVTLFGDQARQGKARRLVGRHLLGARAYADG